MVAMARAHATWLGVLDDPLAKSMLWLVWEDPKAGWQRTSASGSTTCPHVGRQW